MINPSVCMCVQSWPFFPCWPGFIFPGEHLRLCPQDYTCCSSQMEETLALQSDRDFLRAVEDNSQFLLTTFTQRHRRFDGESCVQLLYLMGS